MAKNKKESIERIIMSELDRRGIMLRRYKTPEEKTMFGYHFTLPAHDEKDWLKRYIKDSLESGRYSKDITGLARETYALLRYKQALAGSSDGSLFGAFFAFGGNIPTERAENVYLAALRDFDSRP